MLYALNWHIRTGEAFSKKPFLFLVILTFLQNGGIAFWMGYKRDPAFPQTRTCKASRMGAHRRHFRHLIFLTDFDGTCSLEDTTDVLAKLTAYPNNSCYINLLSILSRNIEDCLSLQIPYTCAFNWKFHHSHLRNLLRKLEDFEKEFNQQVIDQQLLKGICREEIRVAAKKVPLRAGCVEFLFKLAASDTPIHVISANWSKDMIQNALPNIPSNLFSIRSCNLSYDENGVCDGNMELQIQDAFDKEVISEEIYFSKQKNMVVYIGDSMNDILPMLGADLGIIIDTNKTLKKILSLFKIQVDPLEVAATEIRSNKATSFRHAGRLFKVAGWDEVEACLSKLLPL